MYLLELLHPLPWRLR